MTSDDDNIKNKLDALLSEYRAIIEHLIAFTNSLNRMLGLLITGLILFCGYLITQNIEYISIIPLLITIITFIYILQQGQILRFVRMLINTEKKINVLLGEKVMEIHHVDKELGGYSPMEISYSYAKNHLLSKHTHVCQPVTFFIYILLAVIWLGSWLIGSILVYHSKTIDDFIKMNISFLPISSKFLGILVGIFNLFLLILILYTTYIWINNIKEIYSLINRD
jgi:hypothetical protein